MKTKLSTLITLAAAGCFALGASAQTTNSPAAPQPTQVVYSPRLPSAAELTNVAAAQGLTVDKIIQSSTEMTLVYHTANGQTNTVAYMLLPPPGSTQDHAAQETTTVAVAAPSTPAPQVVYTQAPPAQTIYYSAPAPAPVYYSPYYYAPDYYSPWYAPVALSVGFGFGYFYGHDHYHGGGYHGGGVHGGHGGHR